MVRLLEQRLEKSLEHLLEKRPEEMKLSDLVPKKVRGLVERLLEKREPRSVEKSAHKLPGRQVPS